MNPLPHCCLALLLAATAGAAEVLLDAGWDERSWQFLPGAEFPGADGAIAPPRETAGATLAWDFTGGGVYVAARFQGPLPPALASVTLALRAMVPCSLAWRLTDASGRTFQTASRPCPAGDGVLTLACAGPFARAWGGSEGAAPGEPTGLALLVDRPRAAPFDGSLVLRRLSADSAADAAALAEPVALPEPAMSILGWTFAGTWERQWRRPLLLGTLSGGRDADLDLSLPRQGRDWHRRIHLAGGSVPLRLALPLGQANPHGRYSLHWLAEADGARDERRLDLVGVRCDPAVLGAPRPTRELPPSGFGTATHFASAQAAGAFAAWLPWQRLLAEASACGLGWIRDGARLERDGDGPWRIAARDRAWLEEAKRLGLRTIVVLDMAAADPVEALCARGQALAREPGLIDAIELGNEPGNFGGWVKAHGGTWNGREADGGTSPWVKAHLTATNAVAEAIKRARADATVIGLGSPPPVNARALDLGLSPAVDGVVEHPYGFSLPPELIAYGSAFAARDGIAVGDAGNTLAGLLDWYAARLAASGQPRRLWITEFGWSTFRNGLGNTRGLYAGVSETTQADWLLRGHLLQAWHGVAASMHYCLLDDYGSDPAQDQANFGLLRSDGSRKPAFAAMQRLCSLFAGAARDRAATATVAQAPLQRTQRRDVLVADWDGVAVRGLDTVIALPFASPGRDRVRTLAVWSALPPDGFNGRAAEVRVAGWPGFGQALAVGLRSGRVCDVAWRRDGDDLVLELALDDEPLAVQVFRD